MTPLEFIGKWKHHALTERAAAQEHFIDLCRLVGHPTPAEDDPTGERFAFEKGASKTGGGDGFADVWKKGHFAWEYKKRRRDLDEAMAQLTRYAAALENPPLHIACDTIRFRIETRWTNTVVRVENFEIEDLVMPEKLALLRAAFHDPEALRPDETRASLTIKAADKFQTISDRLQHRHPDKEAVAHFVNQLVFCFFANSVKLLPEGLLKKLLETALKRPQKSKDYFDKLFAEMEKGGEFDLTDIRWFNGGLFDGRRALPLQADELGLLIGLHSSRWDLIDPTIFGTLFERFLDPDKRAQIGAHYTDSDKIMMIVEPVVLRPLVAEWEAAKAEIAALMAKKKPDRRKASARREAFVERLCSLRILDPACGSGNFLYLALQGVKDLEYRALLECEAMGLDPALPRVGPRILHGLELNPLAAELARSVIWIGDIQWGVRNALAHRPEPILQKLESIETRDALLNADGSEAEWPEADFIVGNPPFLGGKKLREGLGDAAVERLFAAYAGKVPAEADLVCYWFAKAWEALQAGRAASVGFVSTNSIRGGANRRVLEPIAQAGAIFEAWSDEAWVVDGAAVRVSLVCFGREEAAERRLDGGTVETINADLSSRGVDLTKAVRLQQNANVSFQGPVLVGAFDVAPEIARQWLMEPRNPNGLYNADVLRPLRNGKDLNSRQRDFWVIDFFGLSEKEAALFSSPFLHVQQEIKPLRIRNVDKSRRENWWQHGRSGEAFRAAIAGHRRFIAGSQVSKHRAWVWLDVKVHPHQTVIVIARDDDTTFGILHSRFHEAWSLRLGTWLGVGNDPRYTPTTTFETFPFPQGLTPNIAAADYARDPRAQRIAAAAKRLDDLRRAWLNPPDLVEIVPEVVPGYPDRILPKTVEAAAALKTRTLTNLYNQRPQWLADAHDALDRAVAAAYGWPEDISTEDALANLLALNLERAAAQGSS